MRRAIDLRLLRLDEFDIRAYEWAEKVASTAFPSDRKLKSCFLGRKWRLELHYTTLCCFCVAGRAWLLCAARGVVTSTDTLASDQATESLPKRY
jgi:hypothetical protein